MQATLYLSELETVPVDFFADPDGEWDYERLVAAAGLDPDVITVMIGALSEPWRDHPEGAAVLSAEGQPGFAVVECAAVTRAA